MFLAQNNTDCRQVQEFVHERMQAQPTLHWAALIDRAFDHDSDCALPTCRALNCYEEHPLDELASLAPWLVPLRADEEGVALFAELLTHCSGRPMLSVLASRVAVQDLCDQWRPLHRVRTPDEQRMLLRIADTRILPTLPSILEPAQWAAFAAPLEHWIYIDRDGVAQACPVPPPGLSPVAAPVRLTQAQLDAMTEACETDMLIDYLADRHLELFPTNAAPATVYAYVTEIRAFASKCQVGEWLDKAALITADFLSHGEIRSSAELGMLLRSKEWEPGRLMQALAARGLVPSVA